MAARPIEGPGDLAGYDVEIVRLEAELREDEKGAWRVIRADGETAVESERF